MTKALLGGGLVFLLVLTVARRSGETDHRALAEGDGKRDASNIILEILQFYLQFAGCGGGDDIWKHNLRCIDKNF